MLVPAQLLGTLDGPPRLQTVHLLGAAVPAKGDWRILNDSVQDAVWNYRSTEDWFLESVFAKVQLGSSAARVVGFATKLPKIHDRNVTALVPSHSAYFTGVALQ